MMIFNIRKNVVTLLRRLERLTRTDNVYLAKNLWHTGLTHVISTLNGLVLYILIAKFLPKEVYGQYKYLLSLFGLFSIATLTSFDAALSRAIARGYDASLKTAFSTKLRWGGIGTSIAFAGSYYYLTHNNYSLAYSCLVLGIFAPFIYASSLYASFLQGKKRFDVFSRFTIALSIVYFVIMCIAVVIFRQPLSIFIAFLVASSVNFIAYIYTTKIIENDRIDPDLIPYAKHLSIIDIFGEIASRIDSLIVFHFLGSVQLAIYSIAIIPPDQIKGIFKTIESIAFPKFSTGSLFQIKSGLPRKLLLLTLASMCAAGIYAYVAPLFFRILFPAYSSSVSFSQLYGISIVFAIPASLLLSLFQAKNMRRENTAFNAGTYITQIILLVIGTYYYGLYGTILSRVASRVLMFILSLFLLIKNKDTSSSTPQSISS